MCKENFSSAIHVYPYPSNLKHCLNNTWYLSFPRTIFRKQCKFYINSHLPPPPPHLKGDEALKGAHFSSSRF